MAIKIARRKFIAVLGGTAFAWPIAARAQQSGKLPTIGFLGPGNASGWSAWTAAFTERLSQLGWIEGRTVAIEYRWSEGHPERVAEVAAEFVRQKVDVIVSYGGAVTTLKQTTASIPIVFSVANDPIGSGLVASLSRPGGNVTGLSLQATDIASKRLELLREAVPGLRRLGIMGDGDYSAAVREMGQVQIRRAEDVAPVFEALKSEADALYIVNDTLILANSTQIIMLALSARLPTIWDTPSVVQDGGLMSYGPSFPALLRRTADFVDKILRGTKPGDIPVELPTKFELVINLKTAKTLGLIIPHNLLVLADDVIE
jgi:putative tryptophan/tyrosine transport system substrate-binding protein